MDETTGTPVTAERATALSKALHQGLGPLRER